MAKVKGLTLEAIRTLGKTITFTNYKGTIIAKSRVPKRGPGSTPWLEKYHTRMRVCVFQLHALSQEVVDIWKDRVLGSDWTWKDAFTSAFLSYWRDFNCPPQVMTELAFSWGSPVAQLQFAFADYYLPEPNGYGNDSYGLTPYGAPDYLLDNQPFPLPPKYDLTYTDPIPKPYKTFHSSPPSNPGCTIPTVLPPGTDVTVATTTKAPTEINAYQASGQDRGGSDNDPTVCTDALDGAWDDFINTPDLTPSARATARINLDIQDPPPHWTVIFTQWEATIRLQWSENITPDDWLSADRLVFPVAWVLVGDLSPWKITATLRDITITVETTDTEIVFPIQGQYAALDYIYFTSNLQKPASPCSPISPPEAKFDALTTPTLFFNPVYDPTSNNDAAPPGTPFTTQLTGLEGNPPIVCPPLLVAAGP